MQMKKRQRLIGKTKGKVIRANRMEPTVTTPKT